MEKIRAYYARCLEGNDLPLAWLAVDGGRLLGSAALKRHDITALPQYEDWLLAELKAQGIEEVGMVFLAEYDDGKISITKYEG